MKQEMSKYCIDLHDSFSIQDCTYLNANKGVIFSPINCETLLCDISVIHFLTQLASGTESEVTTQQFIAKHPEHAEDIISKLSTMSVIQFKE